MNIGEPNIAAAEAVSKLFVIDAHQVKNGGMKIMDFQGVLLRLVTPLISSPIHRARLDPGSCHPERESELIMIPAIASLRKGSPPELSRPENESIIQHASRLQILEQARDGLVHGTSVVAVILLQPSMSVPAVLSDVWNRELDEADPALN